jgi:hypothetical protein
MAGATALSGTLTVNSVTKTQVAGTTTSFLSEIAVGQSIKLNSDGDTHWAVVASITDNANLTLTADYTGTTGSAQAAKVTSMFAEPAMVVQAARGVAIRNLAFEGKNVFPAFTTDDLINDTLFINNNCRGATTPGNSQLHTPYAAIAIDPYWPTPPPGGTYPANEGPYPTHAAYYTGPTVPVPSLRASAHVTIEGCSFLRFVVGIVISPTGNNGNGEAVFIRDCSFSCHRVAIAVCESQARNIVIENVTADSQQFFVTNRIYGANDGAYGGGRLPAPAPYIQNVEITQTKYIFNVDVSQQTFSVVNMYAESTLSLGYIGTGFTASGNLGAAFAGCSFNFWTRGGRQIDFHLFNSAACDFRGCLFSADNGKAPVVFFNPQAGLTFGSCSFGNTNMPGGTFPVAFQAPSLVRFEKTKMYDNTMVAPTLTYTVLDGEYSTVTDPIDPNALGSRQLLASPDYVVEGQRLRVVGGTKLKSFGIGSGTLSKLTVTAATSNNPIVITTSQPHGLVDGDHVTITGATGNTLANVTWWEVENTTSTTFRLKGRDGHLEPAYSGNGIVEGRATFSPTSAAVLLPGDIVYALEVPGPFSGFEPEWYNPRGALDPSGSAYRSNVIGGVIQGQAAALPLSSPVTLAYVPSTLWGSLNGATTLAVKYFSRYRKLIHAAIDGDTSFNCTEDPTTDWKPTDRISHPLITPGTYILSTSSSSITLSATATGTDSFASLVDAAGVALVSDGRTNSVTNDGPQYTLVWEIKGDRFSTRFYAAGKVGALGGDYSYFAITMNAQWNANTSYPGQWWMDNTSYLASRLTFDYGGAIQSNVYNGATQQFQDSAWSGSLVLGPPGSGSITMSTAGVVTAPGAITCYAAWQGQCSGASSYVGTGTTWSKVFPSTPSSITYSLLDSNNIGSGPLSWQVTAYGAGSYCQNSSASTNTKFYASVTAS